MISGTGVSLYIARTYQEGCWFIFSGGKMWGSELSGYKTEIEMCNNSNDKSAIQCNLVLTS